MFLLHEMITIEAENKKIEVPLSFQKIGKVGAGLLKVKLKLKLITVIKITENKKKRFAQSWSFSALKPKIPMQNQ